MIIYILKTALCATLFLAIYYILLEKETFHQFKRFYLLATIVLSFIIPALTFKIYTESVSVINVIYPENSFSPGNLLSQQQIPVKEGFQFYNWLLWLYIIVTCFLLFRFLKNLIDIIRIIKLSIKQSCDHAILVLMGNETAPSSFFKYIFLNKNDFENGKVEDEILQHEFTHVKQKHSYDVLFIEWLLVFAWFNPVLYFYKKAIQLNHEFLADETAVKYCNNKKAYQLLLLNRSAGTGNLLIANHFNYTLTKKRLIMLTKSASNKVASICRQITVVLVIAAATFFFSQKVYAQKTTEMKIVDVQLEDLQSKNSVAHIEYKDTANMEIVDVLLDDIEDGGQMKQDTFRPHIFGKPIGSTKEGTSNQLLDEYNAIINKYKTEDKNWLRYLGDNITAVDKQRLINIFKQMNDEQQRKQIVGFLASPKPFSKVIPTAKQFEAFKDPKQYGVWINEKKVNNSVLDNYINTDFDHVFISKLYANAKKDKDYNYQVNLMTKDYYEQYYQNAIKTAKTPIMVTVERTKGKVVQHEY